MKISRQIFQDSVTQVKPKQTQPQVKNDEQQSELTKTDKVSLSSSAQKTAEASGYSPENFRTEKTAESRNDKIDRIKEAIDSNNYNVSSKKVADKVVGAHIN